MRKVTGRKRRHKVLRKKIIGTQDRPRLCFSRSNKNIYAQLIDDMQGRTLLALSTSSRGLKNKVGSGGNLKAAEVFGEEFGKRAIEKGYTKVVFDRSGYLYHGRVKVFADAARKGGLVF